MDRCNILDYWDHVFTSTTQAFLWLPIILYTVLQNRVLSRDGISKDKNTPKKNYKLTVVDHILGLTLIFCTFVNIYVRFERNVPHWLLQPCHILTVLLIYLIYNTNNDPRIFTFYLYSAWMPFLGIAFYDKSWYVYFFEETLFLIQHALMIVIPWYYLMTNRFPDHPKTKFNRHHLFWTAFGVSMLYHCLVLIWASFYFNEDFSGMKCRFPGGEFAGTWFREIMVLFSVVLSFIFGILPELLFRKKGKQH